MITSQKFRLFSNDPKFHNIPQGDRDAEELAVMKVYVNQNRIYRNQVLQDSITKKSNLATREPSPAIDFLQTRAQAYEMKLIAEIDTIFTDKEKIKQTYYERDQIEKQVNLKLERIIKKANSIEGLNIDREIEFIELIEALVQEIQSLYQENGALKQQNKNIADRVAEKEKRLARINRN